MKYNIGILAGGRSSRFGSNKCLQKYQNISILGRLIQEISRLSTLPQSICISIHDQQQYDEIAPLLSSEITPNMISGELWNFQKIPIQFVYDPPIDQKPETRGALIGLWSLIKYLREGFLQVVPCDNPFLTTSIFQTMYNLLNEKGNQKDLILPRWNNGYVEPLHAIYRCDFFQSRIESNIKSAQWKIRDLFLEPIQIQELMIEPDYWQYFANINKPTLISH